MTLCFYILTDKTLSLPTRSSSLDAQLKLAAQGLRTGRTLTGF